MLERLRVRMYRMGFGDCFLLTFWRGDDTQHILFDCGSLSRSKAEVAQVSSDIVQTCSGPDGIARLALVVCTHRHKDHVVGFDDAVWKNVHVGEVWMPWTEDPVDPLATRIRERQSALARALCASLAPGAAADDLALIGLQATEDTDLVLALNALTNDKAMTVLHGGFAGKPPRRFLPEKGKDAQMRRVAGLPGVRFHVLGPSRSESVIRDMDPPQGEAYLGMSDAAPMGANRPVGACDSKWCVDEATFQQERGQTTSFTERNKLAVERLAIEPDGDLAVALDKAVNNTSLLLMIEAGDQFLLFPGDAQWGTWKAVLDQPKLCDLLRRTTFLKVSHHGSHNGTPKVLVDKLLRKNVIAFVSTEPVKQWPGIPREPLMTALAERAILVRSDDAASLAGRAAFSVKDDAYIEWETDVGRS